MEQVNHYTAVLKQLMRDLEEIPISKLIRIYLCSVFLMTSTINKNLCLKYTKRLYESFSQSVSEEPLLLAVLLIGAMDSSNHSFFCTNDQHTDKAQDRVQCKTTHAWRLPAQFCQ